MTKYIIFFFVIILFSCNEDDAAPDVMDEFYFPPLSGNEWAVASPESLQWNLDELENLYDFLEQQNTRAFIVLKNGNIVVEKYWGTEFLGGNTFTESSNWYWASAGKTLTAFLVGKAQEEGHLSISDRTSDYLGSGWTSMSIEKENLISIKNQLTMTTGLEYSGVDVHCTDPECLTFRADPGDQWFYHNAPYTLLEKVVENATGEVYNDYSDQELELQIGMQGTWIKSGFNNVFWSNARSAARFGLLILNNGKWDEKEVMIDKEYLNQMVSTSQDLNPSYGYLWWLNGKNSIIYPGLSTPFNLSYSPSAPADLFSAAGKNGQFIDVVPSEGLVVVRMGESPDEALVPIEFHDEMWMNILKVIN